ncbi:MAG: hypothetical protein Q9198_009623, partial [Flavoplaca austrocitrina]
DEILSYFIVFEYPFHLTLKEYVWDTTIHQVLKYYRQKWPVIELLTTKYRFIDFFYRNNTIRVHEFDISTLLSHQTFPLVDQKAWNNLPVVSISMDRPLRDYLTSLIVCIQTTGHPGNPDPGSLLPELLSCPNLRTVVIEYQEFDSMDDFDGEFKKIENFMMALAEKLGPEMVKVEGSYNLVRGHLRTRKFGWSMAEFRNGRFEGSEKLRGLGLHESDESNF